MRIHELVEQLDEMAAYSPDHMPKKTAISEERKLWELLESQCSDMLSTYHSPLWRGDRPVPNGLIHPSTGLRVHDYSNIYTLIIDTNPAYASWPKLSHSLHCSTSFGVASRYVRSPSSPKAASPMAVFPLNGSRIVVVPNSDMYGVVVPYDTKTDRGKGDKYMTVAEFDIDWLGSELGLSVSDLKVTDAGDVKEFRRRLVDKGIDLARLYRAFSPSSLGLKLLGTNSFARARSNYTNNECWTDGDCVMLDYQTWVNLGKKYLNKQLDQPEEIEYDPNSEFR